MLLGLYKVATELGSPLLALHLRRRARRGKEEITRLGERAGRTTLQRPKGPLLWIHAASVGESLAALPLIETLLGERPPLHVLITTGTVTSARLMATRLPDRAFHQFVPLDRAAAWRAFYSHWRPNLGCLIESEIWPHLILEAKRASLPLTLINGRMSARSAGRWRWSNTAIKHLLHAFELCLARSDTDADRLSSLGAVDVRMLGDLKNATPPLPADPVVLSELQAAIGDRPVWLAASTHLGEEIKVLAAHRALRRRWPDLITVIAPRHPERGERLLQALRSAGGEAIACRSQGERLEARTEVYLADTLGELGVFYRLAKLAFIGGSLVPHGGQNPLEAARLGCPPIFGPHTGNFDDVTANLLEVGAAQRIEDADDLARAVDALLGDPAALNRMASVARDAGRAEEAVLQRVTEALDPLLDRQLGPAASPEPTHACA